MASQDPLTKFKASMAHLYKIPLDPSHPTTSTWTPPPQTAGHRGRYLWTDAFALLNLLTFSKLTSQPFYTTCACTLAQTVHETLGRTRDLTAYLPGASDENPLGGGLRIGKEEASGPDGDGQYHHYLTLWMFALNRLSVACNERKWNDQAIQLAKAIHPAFVYNRASERPRIVWKMSIDLTHSLVRSEGNLDPVDGFVVFRLLQQTDGENSEVLKHEIEDYEKIVRTKWKGYNSSDPLDLGMTLWTAHWMQGEEWANGLLSRAKGGLKDLFDEDYFERTTRRRLAFREFGTALGIRCATQGEEWEERTKSITETWEKVGLVPVPEDVRGEAGMSRLKDLLPITLVMYAAALIPGAFQKGFL